MQVLHQNLNSILFIGIKFLFQWYQSSLSLNLSWLNILDLKTTNKCWMNERILNFTFQQFLEKTSPRIWGHMGFIKWLRLIWFDPMIIMRCTYDICIVFRFQLCFPLWFHWKCYPAQKTHFVFYLTPKKKALFRVNSLFPGRCGCNLKSVIYELMLRKKFMSISCEIALGWMTQNTFDYKSSSR